MNKLSPNQLSTVQGGISPSFGLLSAAIITAPVSLSGTVVLSVIGGGALIVTSLVHWLKHKS